MIYQQCKLLLQWQSHYNTEMCQVKNKFKLFLNFPRQEKEGEILTNSMKVQVSKAILPESGVANLEFRVETINASYHQNFSLHLSLSS